MSDPQVLTGTNQLAGALGDLTVDQLADLAAEAHRLAAFTTQIVQSASAYSLAAYDPSLQPGAYCEGWLFGPMGELHWRRESAPNREQPDACWRAVFVGYRTACPVDLRQSAQDLDGRRLQTVMIQMRGEKRPGQPGWIEPRIPSLVQYPGVSAARAELEIIEYRLDGRLDFWRHVRLVDG